MNIRDHLPPLETFAADLLPLARLRWQPWIPESPEDLVQRCLLDAWKTREDFRGDTEEALVGWLRTKLHGELSHLMDYYRRVRRDRSRERPLEGAEVNPDDSSRNLLRVLFVRDKSPSQKVMHAEVMGIVIPRLNAGLMKLTSLQRQAITLKYLEGWTVAEIGEQLDHEKAKSVGAVGGLLFRGLKALREELNDLKDLLA